MTNDQETSTPSETEPNVTRIKTRPIYRKTRHGDKDLWLTPLNSMGTDAAVPEGADYALVTVRTLLGTKRGTVRVYASDLRELAAALNWRPV